MNPRKYAQVREAVAADKAPEAVGAAQCAHVYMMPEDRIAAAAKKLAGGMDLSGEDAALRAAKVSLGKKSMLFRFGSRPKEFPGAVEELVVILRKEKRKDGEPRITLNAGTVELVAKCALHELAFDRCGTCMGRGEVEDHDLKGLEGKQPMRPCQTCHGQKRRPRNEDDRVLLLARLQAPEDPAGAAKALRANPRLRDITSAVDCAKGVLLESERISVEGAGLMLERWGTEDLK